MNPLNDGYVCVGTHFICILYKSHVLNYIIKLFYLCLNEAHRKFQTRGYGKTVKRTVFRFTHHARAQSRYGFENGRQRNNYSSSVRGLNSGKKQMNHNNGRRAVTRTRGHR